MALCFRNVVTIFERIHFLHRHEKAQHFVASLLHPHILLSFTVFCASHFLNAAPTSNHV